MRFLGLHAFSLRNSVRMIHFGVYDLVARNVTASLTPTKYNK